MLHSTDDTEYFAVGDRVRDTSDPRHIGYITHVHPLDNTVRIYWPKSKFKTYRHPLTTLEHVPPHEGFED